MMKLVFQALSKPIPLLRTLAVIAVAAGLTACGGSDSNTAVSGGSGTDSSATPPAGGGATAGGNDPATLARTMKLALTASGATTNLLNPAGPWTTFNGEPSGISYSASTGLITVPAATAPQTNRTGLHEFTQPLEARRNYVLALDSTNTNLAAVLFLVDQGGDIQRFTNTDTGATAQFSAARPGFPLRFSAPLNVTGFFVQIQETFDVAIAETTQVEIDIAANALTPNLPANAAGDFIPTGFTAAPMFAEEFNGTTLDRSRWCTRLVFGGGPALQAGYEDPGCTSLGNGFADFANEPTNQRFRDVNLLGEELHVVSDGTIKMRATRTDLSRPFQNFEAAALRSKTKIAADPSLSYYITTRIKMPNVRGSWPAVYLMPSFNADGTATAITPPEIDIVEGALNEVEDRQVSITQHSQVDGAQTASGQPEFVFAAPNFNTEFGSWQSPITLRDRWIQASVEWDPKGVCYYVDGYRTACENYKWVTRDGAVANPAEINAFLAIGGDFWAGRHGIDIGSFPIAFEIDYIRVYSKPYVAAP